MLSKSTPIDLEQAATLLGVPASAAEEELRAAYLRQVQQHPPDREPELFEQIRDAYDHIRNPAVRAQAVLNGPDPNAPLATLLEGSPSARVFAGSQWWIELLKEKRS